MSKIIDIRSGCEIISPVDKDLEKLISQGLNTASDEIKAILNIGNREPVVVTDGNFKNLLLDYIVFKLDKSNIEKSLGITMGINYLSELLSGMLIISEGSEVSEVVSKPYFTHWAGKGEFKKAGDASVYKYLFWEPGRKEQLSRDNYIDFAVSGYKNHFGDEEFSNGVGTILPQISGINKEQDFFHRGIKGI